MKPKELILSILENERRKNLLFKMFNREASFTELKKKAEIENNTTLSRDLDFFDSNGMIVNIFGRTEDGHYSFYRLNHYGRRITEIVKELDSLAEEKADKAIPA